MIAYRGAFAGLIFALSSAASAQTFPFQLLVTQNGNAVTIQNGATVTLLAPVGQSQTAQLQATYTGTGQATISTQPNLFGSPTFKATIPASLPITLTSGSSVTMTIQFTPTSSGATTGEINLPYSETLATGANNGTIAVSLQGTTPAFTLSYELQTNQNVIPLQPGGTIPFAPTLVGSTATAALNLTNTGSGPGTINNIQITTGPFVLQGTPLLPATVVANGTLPVEVLYTPTGVASDTGQITITFATGAPVTINLTGSGTSPSFTYQLLNTSPPTAVLAGGTITLPATQIGQTSTLTMRVVNSGNALGTITSINAAGQGFTLTNVPPGTQTLAAGASLTFTINFTPSQPGAATGTLLINSASFTLSGNGLGAQLTYSYVAGGATVTLTATNNSVVFSPIAITQSEQLSIDVKNTGTLPATISNIGPSQASGPFTVTGLPPLPVTVAPNADFHITITFAPVNLGFANSTLMFDATQIGLIGSGTQPPALPAYTISGPNTTGAPMTQPSIGLTLASGYPVDLTGTLTLTITGSLPADPAVQFATGVRTVAFTIPANQTGAVFGSLGQQIGIQTGTVANTIALIPTFATKAGNVDITPASPANLQFSIAPAAPVLIGSQIANLTLDGFTIEVTGYSTTRSLKSFAAQFTTAPGYSMPTSQFTVDVSQIATVWFNGTASEAFGGQFTLSIPFVFTIPGVPATQSTVTGITSASVTVSNATGTSNALQATIP